MIKAVVNTKGGTGKSTIALHVLPIVAKDVKKLSIFRIDSSNKSSLPKEQIKSQNFAVKDIDSALAHIDFDLLSDKDIIIDCGAGEDTIQFIKGINNLVSDEIEFYIPTNDDYEQYENVFDTLSLIKAEVPKAKSFLVLNRCIHDNLTETKMQFYNIFGNKDYGVDSRFDTIQPLIDKVLLVNDTPIFSLLKGKYQKYLIDIIEWAKNLVENETEYKKQWAKEGKSVFFSKVHSIQFAKKVLLLEENIKGVFNVCQS